MMSMLLRLNGWGICVLAMLLVVGAAQADTAADVAKVDAHLKRAQANLDSVNGSIGHRTSPPKGSAAKLSQSRLDQAYGDLEPAGKLVAGLPAGAEGVADVATRYNAAVELYTKLQKILTGGKSPVPADGGAREGEVKLGYPHADNFKSVLFTLRNKVEAPANQLTKAHGELLPVEDQLTINHRVTAQAMATIAEARRQAGFVDKSIAPIPANGRGVAAAHERLAAARQQIDGSEQYFKPLHAQLMAMIDPAQFPQFNQDRKLLQSLGGDYSQDWIFQDNRVRVAELFNQRQAAQAEVIRVAGVYRRLMQQNTDMGGAIEAVGNGALNSFKSFDAKIEEQKTALPVAIREHMAEADKYANEAVQNQKPAWFNGGIPQRMGWVDDKLTLYLVLAPEAGVGLEKEVDAMKASLKQRADSLKELIIRENTLPNNTYAGADRDAVIAMAVDAWKHQQKEFEVLTVCIPSEAWSRETKWTYSNGTWYFVDKSTLQVRLIVADHENPKQAIDRAINVRKDHQKNDTLYGVPLRSFEDELQPNDYLLRAKIK